MITVFIRRVVPLLALAAALVLLVRIQDFPVVGSDTYLHLRLGEEFRSGWSLAHPGHLSVFDSAQWYPSQWLSQIVMSWTDDHVGIGGVIWLAGAFVIALPLAMYVACRRDVAPLPASLAAVIGTCAAAPGLSARPQVVSYLLILLVTVTWLATARDAKPRWWLVLVAWAWVPIHGMWLVGISIALATIVGMALTREHDLRVLGRLAAIPVLSALVPVLTPLGVHAYSTVVGVSDRNSELTEWGPPDFTSPNALVLLLMIVIVVVTALRSGPVDWPTVMVMGLAIAWGLFSVRTTIVAGVMLTPLVALSLQRIVPPVERIGRRELGAVLGMGAIALVALGLAASAKSDDRPVASWVDTRLDAMPDGTKVLNDWELGHYALWRHPQLQLVMHGYVDVFTVEELERNIGIASLAPDFVEQIDDLDVDYAMVDPDSRLGYALTDVLGWDVVEADDDYELLTPPRS
ncbi:hypothetical protein SAMN04489844_4249 [Nocardioides exalbidus]|uniref:Dolichyl-phosphate-mannose-protein mannosyltransferase n=1 Tax=Nocardioides exalbidus TaxID=402596 RepID=A0A1H5A1M3_9ACTN|nr:hypothetical protein [Nocardioides exalbidus]SED35828.1 hypothetical protein SAMN04489844_4249 [Nocardioides exalbidus]